MRRFVCLAATAMLAACGEGGEDFSVDVAMAPDKARAELGRLDGGDLLRALHLRPITAQRNAEGELLFVLPGDDGEQGTLLLRFEETETHGSRIHVALDLPALTRTIDGERMVLSETKVEASLKEDLESWAQAVGSRGYASLDDLNSTLGGTSIALQPDKLDQLLAAAEDPDKLAAMIDPEFLTDDEGSDGYDATSEEDEESPDMGEPQVDPNEGLAAASAPMDDAKGIDPNS